MVKIKISAVVVFIILISFSGFSQNYQEIKRQNDYAEYLLKSKVLGEKNSPKAYTINETIGGDDILGSLKIDIAGDNLQVWRNIGSSTWEYQYFEYSSYPGRGVHLYADGEVYFVNPSVTDFYVNGVLASGPLSYYYDYSGTEYDRIDIDQIDNYNATVKMTKTGVIELLLTINYPAESDYINYTWEITNLSGSSMSDIRFYAGGDTYSYGSDNGVGYWDGATNTVGCQKDDGGEIVSVFMQGLQIPYEHESAYYDDVHDHVIANSLTGTVTTTDHDNAIALEWRKATLANNETWTITAIEKYSDKVISDLIVTAPLNETITPGETKNITFNVRNMSTGAVNNIALTEIIDLAGWTVNVTNPAGTFNLAIGADQDITVEVYCLLTANVGNVAQATLTADNGSVSADDVAYIEVVAPDAVSVFGTITYDNTTSTPISSQEVKLMQGATEIATTTTDGSGNYSFDDVADGSYTVTPNITLDWKGVTAMDATLYKKHITAVSFLTGLKWRSGDIVSPSTPPANPTLTAADLTPIYQRIITQISSFSEVGDFANSDGDVTVAGSNQIVDMQIICYGDANASYSFSKNELQPIDVENQDVLFVENGEYIEIPILVSVDVFELASVTLEITYNNNILNINNVTMSNKNNNNNDLRFNIEDGRINLAYSTLNFTNFNQSDILFYLCGNIVNITEQTSVTNQINGEFGNYSDEVIDGISFIMPELSPKNTTSYSSFENNLLIYPNPVKNILTICNANESIVEIYNVFGKLISTYKINENSAKISVQNLSEGTYIIKTIRNNEIVTKKLTVIK
ncbi:MAG: T9SS type A sorting domain-containing protein [Bacteroidales bacterium]|nr:T9SS type A sorting domain-containing protein [Bacteroidales bacterium]